jgi:hypothetical protein
MRLLRKLRLEHFHKALMQFARKPLDQIASHVPALALGKLDVRQATHVRGVERPGYEI